jgi:hypothetical protein
MRQAGDEVSATLVDRYQTACPAALAYVPDQLLL